jgi:hypothetical protein
MIKPTHGVLWSVLLCLVACSDAGLTRPGVAVTPASLVDQALPAEQAPHAASNESAASNGSAVLQGFDSASSGSNTATTASSDGTVIWEGVDFHGTYDNGVDDCSLGRANTQYGILTSYVTGIETDVDAGSVKGQHVVNYGHGVTDAYPYEGTVYRAHVVSNRNYMQFWHGSRTLDKHACDSGAYCKETFTIEVNGADAFGKNVGAPFLSSGNKQAAVLLRGVNMRYGSSLDYVKKFQDAEMDVWLDSTALPTDGQLSVNVATNFNGRDAVEYDVTVYYVIVAFDPSYVSVTTMEGDSNRLDCDANHYCSNIHDVTLSGVVPSSTFHSDTVDGGEIVPMFVGLKGWGFDQSSVEEEFHRIRSGARLYSYDASRVAQVREFGEVFRQDCNLTSDGSQHWRTNELSYRVIACKDTSVCQAVYSTSTFYEVAWTQKAWDTIKDGFETVFEVIVDAAEDAANWVDHAAESAANWWQGAADTLVDLITPGNDDFPARQVLVVLKAGETIEALTHPTANTVIAGVYAAHGTPTVTQEFPYADQDAVESQVEVNVMQPYGVRSWLASVGIAPSIAIPPLHRFYVLDFTGVSGEDERDDVIHELAAASKLQQVSANYVAKLNAAPGSTLYSSSLIWFQPYLQTWWPQINDAVSFLALALLKPEHVHDSMALLYPPSTGARLARSAQHAFDPALATTHYQFPGRAPYPKDVCNEFVSRRIPKLGSSSVASHLASASVKSVTADIMPPLTAAGSFTGMTMPQVTPQKKATPLDIGKALLALSETGTSSGAKTSNPTPISAPLNPVAHAVRCAAGELLVKYASGLVVADRSALEADIGLTRLKHFALSDSYLYAVNASKSVTQALDQLQSRPEISYAEPNVSFQPLLLPVDPDYQSGSTWHLYSPANPQNGNVKGISAPGAWDRTTGSRSVTVAVIDNGTTVLHPDFFDANGNKNIFYNTTEDELIPGTDTDGDGLNDKCNYRDKIFTDCQDLDGNGYAADVFGWNFLDDTGDVEDHFGHGIAMAGLIGAVGNNGVNLPGVSWQVTILPLKVASTESPSAISFLASDIIEAVNYAANRGAAVVNMSFGSSDSQTLVFGSTDLETTIRNAASMVFVASAGNGNTCLDPNGGAGCSPYVPNYPASYDANNIISVGASTRNGTRWVIGAGAGSNYGARGVDIFAPGEEITTLDLGGGSSLRPPGSSPAAALVSGTVALMYSVCPNVTPTTIKDAIIKTAYKVSALQSESVAGGVLDAKEAVEECLKLNDNDPSNDVQPLEECKIIQENCQNAAPATAPTPQACGSIPGALWNQDMHDAGYQGCNCEACPTVGSAGSLPACSVSTRALAKTGWASSPTSLVVFSLLGLVFAHRSRRRRGVRGRQWTMVGVELVTPAHQIAELASELLVAPEPAQHGIQRDEAFGNRRHQAQRSRDQNISIGKAAVHVGAATERSAHAVQARADTIARTAHVHVVLAREQTRANAAPRCRERQVLQRRGHECQRELRMLQHQLDPETSECIHNALCHAIELSDGMCELGR